MRTIEIFPLAGLPEVRPGDDLARLVGEAARATGVHFRRRDIVVIAQKAVSKAEGRVVALASVMPSQRAKDWGKTWNKDARVVELVLQEARRVVRMERGLIIAETRHGFVCANAGVDVSNAPAGCAILLPENPDQSAARLKADIDACFDSDIGVIVADTFGRAWREGQVNVALGVAGMPSVLDYRGTCDGNGAPLRATVIAVADEIAGAAELVMGKADRIPVAIVRGFSAEGVGSGHDLIRPAERDLFR